MTVPAGLPHRPRAIVRTVTLCFKPLVAPTQFLEEDGQAACGVDRNRRTTGARARTSR